VDLPGRVVVTGGAAGMGEAMGRQFASAGASVVVSDIDIESTTRIAREIGSLGCPRTCRTSRR
jgi:NAD(P)-dependent dehydrogenase (short-subunit alcohol dehydrogenase family)